MRPDPLALRKHLAQQVRSRRDAVGLSQEALAAASGLSDRRIRGIEGGKAKNVGLDNLCALAGALKCSIDDLLGPAAAESESPT